MDTEPFLPPKRWQQHENLLRPDVLQDQHVANSAFLGVVDHAHAPAGIKRQTAGKRGGELRAPPGRHAGQDSGWQTFPELAPGGVRPTVYLLQADVPGRSHLFGRQFVSILREQRLPVGWCESPQRQLDHRPHIFVAHLRLRISLEPFRRKIVQAELVLTIRSITTTFREGPHFVVAIRVDQ
jgi:hypothetical protein